MSQTDKKIAEALIAITNPDRNQRFPIMMGTVVPGSVNETEMTCSVVLSVNDETTPTTGVLLNALLEGTLGLVLFPYDYSVVWVAEIDGPGKYGIVKCSNSYKMQFTSGNETNIIMDAANSAVTIQNAGAVVNIDNAGDIAIAANPSANLTISAEGGDNTLAINTANASISIDTTGKLTITSGNASVTLGSSGISIVNNTKSLITVMQNILTHIQELTVTCAGPGSPSTVPVNIAAFIADQTDISNILY